MTSPAGQQLTQAHRLAQLAVRATSLNRLVGLWPGFEEADIAGSWSRLASPVISITQQGFLRSAEVAGNYYAALRATEGVRSIARPIIAAVPSAEQLSPWLEIAGPQVAGVLYAHGRTDVSQQTFVSLAGSVGKNVLEGGRETIMNSAEDDDAAEGFQRVAGPGACDWCEELAGQGGVYRSRDSAGDGDTWHPHCACEPEPVFETRRSRVGRENSTSVVAGDEEEYAG